MKEYMLNSLALFVILNMGGSVIMALVSIYKKDWWGYWMYTANLVAWLSVLLIRENE